MKVLLINGSPNIHGCTYTALEEVAKTLEEEQIETEIFHIGSKPVRGCMDCGVCYKFPGKCAYGDDTVNEAIELAEKADGLIFGAPVHYASASGAMTSFLDRFFYCGQGFPYKPGAAVVSLRRAGSTASLDQLNKYFTISSMPIVSSQYWNMVHGNTPEEVKQDIEGMQIMRTLGRNMAWLLKCIEAGKNTGIPLPKKEERIFTNFIR
ncbi:flavodoxin family protein [Anaerocolumna sp. AGMB13020]|uniref:flavodoxin family protein n=1 Tax=Anaerocolumna sp. AGMB13020 TaxID=3081750 RepID=UPI002953221E|nr:flavodoxin family protein [Anaerocolumna sp. AGMB13020]WOO34614.1 flavodoxin family protein [Anaerocolumna sp. AGMB13020]